MKCGEADAADCLRDIDLEKLREYMLNVNDSGSSGRLINYDKLGNPGGIIRIFCVNTESKLTLFILVA
jgi:hypothetical protein